MHVVGIHHLGHACRSLLPVVCSRIARSSLLARVVHADVQQEAVELRFGQRDRCRPARAGSAWPARRTAAGSGVGGAGIADRAFLHRLEQRGLGLGRGAVELVGEQQVGEDRALLELEVALAGAVVLFQHLGAEDVAGHQVRGELDAAELPVPAPGRASAPAGSCPAPARLRAGSGRRPAGRSATARRPRPGRRWPGAMRSCAASLQFACRRGMQGGRSVMRRSQSQSMS